MNKYTNEELIKLVEFGEDVDWKQLAEELAKRLDKKEQLVEKIQVLIEEQ